MCMEGVFPQFMEGVKVVTIELKLFNIKPAGSLIEAVGLFF